jgi:hypothetical protein
VPNHRQIYCSDWACPAAASCAQHWGRSEEYATTDGGPKRPRKVKLMKYPRDPLLDCCIAYVPCERIILRQPTGGTEISRRHRIIGSRNTVWRFFNRRKITFKKTLSGRTSPS